MASDTPKYDIVIFGATGFTGQYVVEEVARTIEEESGLTWAIAGRTMAKLQKCLATAASHTGKDLDEIPILIADTSSSRSLQEMCSKAKVLINCVGPYRYYVDPVVKACIETKTHHVDICGEPGVLEKIQLLYNSKAKENNVYIVGSCGFDSIPADMGTHFVKTKFDGELNSIEAFIKVSAPKGYVVHAGTWESAVEGLATSSETARQRKLLYSEKAPKPQHSVSKRPTGAFSNEVNSYLIPFQGSDGSVIYRTERYNLEHKKQRMVQFKPYFCLPTYTSVIMMMIFGGLFFALSSFSLGRYLLKKFPGFFSFGYFSHKGSTRSQLAATTFSYTLMGQGYSTKTALDEPHTDLPEKKLAVKVSGPDLGYIGTSTMLVQSAYALLRDQDKLPESGGVYTPAVAFADTDLIEKLDKHGIKFEILEN